MRAFVVRGPGDCGVEDVLPPRPGPGEVVVDVTRVGICGTDVEFLTGDMTYLHTGHASYPVRLGHEWCGTVGAVGEGVDASWVGRRTTGDTMLGCGRCARCRGRRQHLCEQRQEVGIRGGRPGALAGQLAVPAGSLHALPDAVDDAAGAMVEPGGNALRAVQGAALRPGQRLLVVGPGTIGLLAALFALERGAQVHVLGVSGPSLEVARSLGVSGAWTRGDLPDVPFDAVVDASGSPAAPALALDLVEPGGRLVLIGIAGSPSTVDTRALAIKDVTAVGVLSASPALAATTALYARGAVDPRPLVAAVVGLDEVGAVLAGSRPAGAGPGPKVHVDPRR